MLGYVSRFDKDDGGKAILPYTYFESADGRLEWRWQSFPTPRTLYRLDRMAARPNDWVLVVEGEKTTDAAAELFADHVVVTSPGGSKAANKADWSPLKNRKVAIWPDGDEAGRGYAADVARAWCARPAPSASLWLTYRRTDRFPQAGWLGGLGLGGPAAGWMGSGRVAPPAGRGRGKDTLVPDFSSLLDEAAALDTLDYDRRRDQLAEELGVRKFTLDAEVAKRRQDRQEERRLFLDHHVREAVVG